MEWIESDKELPGADGKVWITNRPIKAGELIKYEEVIVMGFYQAVAFYDGYGFLFDGIYRPAQFWMPYKELKKRYGKIINE